MLDPLKKTPDYELDRDKVTRGERAALDAVGAVTQVSEEEDLRACTVAYAPKAPPASPLVAQATGLTDHLRTLSDSDGERVRAMIELVNKITLAQAQYREQWDREMEVIEDAIERLGQLKVQL